MDYDFLVAQIKSLQEENNRLGREIEMLKNIIEPRFLGLTYNMMVLLSMLLIVIAVLLTGPNAQEVNAFFHTLLSAFTGAR